MGRFFKTSLPEFTDKPVLSTAPLELIAATQTAVVDKQAKTLDYGTTLINMLAQMPHMKEHDPIVKEKLDEVTKELQGLFQEMDKNPMSSHQTLQKALLYGQDLVKELTTGDFKTITDSYNAQNKGLTINQKILADDFYAQPTYLASLKNYATNMRDDEGNLKPYEFPYLAPTPDLLGGLATMARTIPMQGRIESVAGGGYDYVEERSEQDILKYLHDNTSTIRQIIDPQLNAIRAQKGYYEDDLAEKYAANYNYDNAIRYDPVTNQYSINEELKGTTLGDALKFAISQRDKKITRYLPSGGRVSAPSEARSRSKSGGTPSGLDEKPDGTVVDPVKVSHQNLDSNPDMQHKNDYNEHVSTKWTTFGADKTKRPTNIEAQKVQVMTIAKSLYDTYTSNQKTDPQLFWNLVASVAHEYFDRNGTAFDKLMASFEGDEFFAADKLKIKKATRVATSNPHFSRNDLPDFIRFNALNEGAKNHYNDLAAKTYNTPDGQQFIGPDMDLVRKSSYFVDISPSILPANSFEKMLYVLEQNTGKTGTTFKNEYLKTSSCFVPTFNLPVDKYPVALNGKTEAEVASMEKSSIIIKRRINEADELSDAEIWNSLFTKKGIKDAQPIISYRGCDSKNTAQYFATIKDADGINHVLELSDKDGLISTIYGWDFTDITTTPFFDIDNKSQTDALVALWESKLKNGTVSRQTYEAFIEKAADTEKAKAESYIAEQVLDAEDMSRRYLIPEDGLLSTDFIDNNTGTKLKDVSGTKEFKDAEIITKEVEYKGIKQVISIVFDKNHTPYSIIETDGQVHVKPLSSAFNNQIQEEARIKVYNIYDTAVLKANK